MIVCNCKEEHTTIKFEDWLCAECQKPPHETMSVLAWLTSVPVLAKYDDVHGWRHAWNHDPLDDVSYWTYLPPRPPKVKNGW